MSRSYKKTLRTGDKKNNFLKKYANRKLRHDENIIQNKCYKKTYCSYNICDYEDVGTSFEQFYQRKIGWWRILCQYHKDIPVPTEKEAWIGYCKLYIRK